MRIDYNNISGGDTYYAVDIYNEDIYYCYCQEIKHYYIKESCDGKHMKQSRKLFNTSKKSIPFTNGIFKQNKKTPKEVNSQNIFSTEEEAKSYFISYCQFIIKDIENYKDMYKQDDKPYYHELNKEIEKYKKLINKIQNLNNF